MAILGSDPYPGPDPYQKMIQETDILDPLKRYHRLFEARIHSGLGNRKETGEFKNNKKIKAKTKR